MQKVMCNLSVLSLVIWLKKKMRSAAGNTQKTKGKLRLKKPNGSSPFSHALAKGWLAPWHTSSGPRLWGLWGLHWPLRAVAVYLEFWHSLQERTAFRFPSTDFFFPKHRQWLGLKATKQTEWWKLRSCKQEMIAKPMPRVWPMQASTSSQLLVVNLNGVFSRFFSGDHGV